MTDVNLAARTSYRPKRKDIVHFSTTVTKDWNSKVLIAVSIGCSITEHLASSGSFIDRI